MDRECVEALGSGLVFESATVGTIREMCVTVGGMAVDSDVF